MTDLSRSLAARVAALLVDDFLRDATEGRCLRLDHLQEADCHIVRDEAASALAQLPPSSPGFATVQVAVLGSDNRPDDSVISSERAIELRNRMTKALLLLVPAGVDSPAASSLENSFEAIDIELLFDTIVRNVHSHLPRSLRVAYDQMLAAQATKRSVFPRSRQARAEYLLVLDHAHAANDSIGYALHEAGAHLHLMGLIPDLGGESFTTRLTDNAACAAALVKPVRSHEDARTRLRGCPLRQDDSDAYRAIERYVAAVPRLSERTWLRDLAHPNNRAITFEHWPLIPSADSDLVSLEVKPFVERGVIPSASGLRDPQDGTLPYCSATGGFVKIKWATGPAKPHDVARWRVEILPSPNWYGQETDFSVDLPAASPKGTVRSSKLAINLDPEDLENAPDVVVVRVQALDRNGQVLRLAGEDRPDGTTTDEELAQAFSEEFRLDSAPSSGSTSVRRESTPSLPIARLRALATAPKTGATTEIETCEGWQQSDLAYLQLQFGRNQGARIALSIPLRELEQQILDMPENGGRYVASLAAGQTLSLERVMPTDPAWAGIAGKAFTGARREFFEAVRGQSGRGLVEVADFDDELARLAAKYVATYGRVLQRRDTASPNDLRALTALDTLRLRIELGRRDPVDALVVLPTHPLRVAWYAAYFAELESWRPRLADLPADERAAEIDLALLTRLSPARVPFLLNDDAGTPYVFSQNLRLLHGLYLPVHELDPATATNEIIDVLGLPASDVRVGEVPASRLADRIRLYRDTHQQPERLRILAANPGSGAFLADALRLVTTERDEYPIGGDGDSSLPPHLLIQSFGEGSSETNPLPGLRTLQRELVENRSRSRIGRGFLDPELELSAAPLDAVETATDAHLAVLADVSRPELVIAGKAASHGTMSFHGLITRSVTEADEVGRWVTGIDFPQARGTELTELHRRFAEAVTAQFAARPELTGASGDSAAASPAALDSVPSTAAPPPDRDQIATASEEPRGGSALARVRMDVSGMTERVLDLAHERCDWVVVLDRFLGLEAFDEPTARTKSGRRYILDYAPEFLDGLGHQMAITTAHRADVEKMFHKAMIDLGFNQPDESVSSVIDELLLISGRLVLAATGEDNRAKEAVALAAVVAHLRRRGDLDDTIVVPVDAHPELFGVHAQRRSQASQQRARRCDLLLVRFPSTRRISIEAVEVKSRGILGSEELARDIASQVLRTNDLVHDLFFSEPSRIDRPLQRARLASLLRFYLRRAERRHLVTNPTDLQRMTEAIERLDQAGLHADYRGSGYIVVLAADGSAEFDVDGIPIRTLTVSNLGIAEPSTTPLPTQRSEPSSATAPIETPASSVATSTSTGAAPPVTTSVNPGHVVPDGQLPLPAPSDKDAAEVQSENPGDPVPPANDSEHAGPGRREIVRVTLGTTLPPEQDVVWEASTSGSPHLFILGIPGQGKSETTIRLLQGAAADGLPALVIDFHGQFATDTRRPESLRVYDAAEGLPFSPFELTDGSGRFAYRINATSISEIFGYVCGLGDIQRDVFYEALVRAYEDHGHGGPTPDGIPTIDEVRQNLAVLEKERGVPNVVARCRPLLEYGLFTDSAGARIQDLIREGLIIDLHGFAEVEQAQIAAGAFLLRKVYKDMFSWSQTGELRLAIVLDEAHRLAKDATLPKLMKEGRKFGVAVIVASQGLDDFHPDILANAGSKIIFRTNHPQSRRAAGFLRTRTGKDLSEDVEQLPVGNAYVQTPAMTSARRTRMFRPE